MFMDDSVLECSQMVSFNWPEALTGLIIRNGLGGVELAFMDPRMCFCLSDGVSFHKLRNTLKEMCDICLRLPFICDNPSLGIRSKAE